MPATTLVTQRHHHHHHHHYSHHHHHHQPQSRPNSTSLGTPPSTSSITPLVSAVPSVLGPPGRDQPAPPITLQLQIPPQNNSSTYRYPGPVHQLPPVRNTSPVLLRGNPNPRPSGPRGPRRPGTPVSGGSPNNNLHSAPSVWPPYDIDDEVPTIPRSNLPILNSTSPIRTLNTETVQAPGRSSDSPTSATTTTPRRILSDTVFSRPLSYPGPTAISRATTSVRASPVGQEINIGEVGGIFQGISPTSVRPLQSRVRSSPMRREIGGSSGLPADEDTVMG